jgi:hypothetical protein
MIRRRRNVSEIAPTFIFLVWTELVKSLPVIANQYSQLATTRPNIFYNYFSCKLKLEKCHTFIKKINLLFGNYEVCRGGCKQIDSFLKKYLFFNQSIDAKTQRKFGSDAQLAPPNLLE